MLKHFADAVDEGCARKNSILIAGLDPQLDQFPEFILTQAQRSGEDIQSRVYQALTSFYLPALETLAPLIPAIKPNIAFFEQYGPGGVAAFRAIALRARELGLLVVNDCKRGDIGSTASAYARAFLGESTLFGENLAPFPCDAVTVNPFLGFETVEPFLELCSSAGKGVFVLVRTSNPGAADIQGERSQSGESVTERIARWAHSRGEALLGASGVSSLGVVVGATAPAEARQLRAMMPNALFLIPGFGAQGGSAADAVSGLRPTGGTRGGIRGAGGLVNVSRGLFSAVTKQMTTTAELQRALAERAAALSAELNAARAG